MLLFNEIIINAFNTTSSFCLFHYLFLIIKSRFGKFIKLFFSPEGIPIGGEIEKYMLERGRVIGANINEGSFHIFHQLLSVNDHELDTLLKIQNRKVLILYEDDESCFVLDYLIDPFIHQTIMFYICDHTSFL